MWNHRSEKAVKLTEELNNLGIKAIFCPTAQECVDNADVIITATYADKPIVNLEWVKSNVHINGKKKTYRVINFTVTHVK